MSRALIAILRGIQPAEAAEIAAALWAVGIDRIEVPLNSPDPFSSIENIISALGDKALIGAGTVLSVEQVEHLAGIGGKMVVSPNCNTEVIRATKTAGMKSYPGVLTPTECFDALDAGADGLKIFPSFQLGTNGLRALRTVLPEDTGIYAVGGVGADNFASWVDAGATGFGVGGSLYKPGYDAAKVSALATGMVNAYDNSMKR